MLSMKLVDQKGVAYISTAGSQNVITTYRLRLYPTKTQGRLMDETVETCRRLYNGLLAETREKRLNFYQKQASLVTKKDGNKYLKAVHSQVLQDVNARLDKAFISWFEGLTRRPRFKRRGRYNSFTYPQQPGFRIVGNRLELSKVGSVKMRLHREIMGEPKRCTVIRDIDRWYAAIQVKAPGIKAPYNDKPPVGVDLGLLNLAVLSDGTKFENPHHLRKSVGEIKALQRSLSRKKERSKNREKARLTLAKAWRKIRNQRLDHCHRISHYLAKNHSTIVFEDLHIPKMVKNHNLAGAIMDAAWGQLRTLTAYKAERDGGRVILVNPSGSSQECSQCDVVVPKTLDVRVHRCGCGLVLDRAVNAAKVVLQRGLERARAEEQPLVVAPIRRISKFAPVKQEAHGFSRG